MKAKKIAKATQNAVLYIRCSQQGQADEGVTLPAQEAALRGYCAVRSLEIVEVVVDAAVSGGVPLSERPGGQRVRDLLASGAAGSVVALKLDRLFRNTEDALGVTRGWDEKGVALHLVDLGGQSIDTSTAMGRFVLTVLAGLGEAERGLIRERTITALAHKRARGERTGSLPYGYALAEDGVHLAIDPVEQQRIARIYALRDAGLSLTRIADALNAEGVPARGSRWHRTTVDRILALRAREAAGAA